MNCRSSTQIERGMKSVKVVVVGDGAVGKTCMMIRYTSNCYDPVYVPTVLDVVTHQCFIGNDTYSLQLYDTAGQEEMVHLRKLAYTNATLIMMCFALDSQESLANLEAKWAPEVQTCCPGGKVFVVGTKSDLEKKVDQGEIDRICEEIHAIGYMEVSAAEDSNISNAFTQAVTLAIQKEGKQSKRICNIV